MSEAVVKKALELKVEMELSLRDYATSKVQDLAVKDIREDRIIFRSNHFCAHYLLPVRGQNETLEGFEARLKAFRERLGRHSDRPERLAYAFFALRKDGQKQFSAADHIRQELKAGPSAKRAEFENAGIGYAYQVIEPWPGSTKRSRRRKQKKCGVTDWEREVDVIRKEATRFISGHKNFEAAFDRDLQCYREMFARDAEWYAQAEKASEERVAAFENRGGPFEWWEAMCLPAAAHLYHEQNKFDPAIVYYRKAIRAAREAIMSENLRSFVLSSMRLGVRLCKRRARIFKMLFRGCRPPECQGRSESFPPRRSKRGPPASLRSWVFLGRLGAAGAEPCDAL